MLEQIPDFSDSVDQEIEYWLSGVWTALPARVVDFDADAPTVHCKPVHIDHWDSDGNVQAKDISDLPDLLACYPGGGEAGITWPYVKGDIVLLIVCARSLEEYQNTDGREDVKPKDPRIHHPNDAIVIGRLSTLKNKMRIHKKNLIAYNGEKVETHWTKDGEYQVKAEKVRLGTLDASKAVAKGDETQAAIDALKQGLNELRIAIAFPPVIIVESVKSSKVFLDA